MGQTLKVDSAVAQWTFLVSYGTDDKLDYTTPNNCVIGLTLPHMFRVPFPFFIILACTLCIDVHPRVVKKSSSIGFYVSVDETSHVVKGGKVLGVSADCMQRAVLHAQQYRLCVEVCWP